MVPPQATQRESARNHHHPKNLHTSHTQEFILKKNDTRRE